MYSITGWPTGRIKTKIIFTRWLYAILEFYPHDKIYWPGIIYLILYFGEKLGSGRVILDNIGRDPKGVLSKETNVRIKVPGFLRATWQVIDESKAY